MCLQEGFLYGVKNETERNWHKLVIKPETSKRNHRNKWNHRNDENETRSPDQKLAWKKKTVNDNKMNAIRHVSIMVYSWSNSREDRSLDCHVVVVCFGPVISSSSFRWYRLFHFGRFVSLFRVLAGLHFTS